jgi:D-3-phosphoglycerate dehydrogenase
MTSPVVAVTDSVFPSLDPSREVLKELGAELRIADEPTPESILEVAQDADGLLVTYAQVNADLIEKLERCKVISRFGIGYDNVDIDAASARGIVVTYVPDYCVDEVADHAMALLLALARKVTFSNDLVQNGRWEMQAVAPLFRLRGRTLGLIGFGKIPRAVVPKAQAFGIKVIASDPYISEETFSALGVEQVDFEQLVERSDYVSIHAPLTPETEHLMGAEAFRKMKPEALIVNTARGAIVDTEALVEALNDRQISGAALDVLPEEPPSADSKLLGRPDIILTPHTGFYSEDSLLDLQTKAANDLASVLRGEPPKYPVNPQVLEAGPQTN